MIEAQFRVAMRRLVTHALNEWLDIGEADNKEEILPEHIISNIELFAEYLVSEAIPKYQAMPLTMLLTTGAFVRDPEKQAARIAESQIQD